MIFSTHCASCLSLSLCLGILTSIIHSFRLAIFLATLLHSTKIESLCFDCLLHVTCSLSPVQALILSTLSRVLTLLTLTETTLLVYDSIPLLSSGIQVGFKVSASQSHYSTSNCLSDPVMHAYLRCKLVTTPQS